MQWLHCIYIYLLCGYDNFVSFDDGRDVMHPAIVQWFGWSRLLKRFVRAFKIILQRLAWDKYHRQRESLERLTFKASYNISPYASHTWWIIIIISPFIITLHASNTGEGGYCFYRRMSVCVSVCPSVSIISNWQLLIGNWYQLVVIMCYSAPSKWSDVADIWHWRLTLTAILALRYYFTDGITGSLIR